MTVIAKDIRMVYDPKTQEWDVKWDNGDFEREEGLTTAVEMSLFTDARAADDDILPQENGDKRGWWGDLISPVEEGDEIGSKLWLLERSKTTDEVLRLAKDYAKESLMWMVRDKVVAKVETEAFRQG